MAERETPDLVFLDIKMPGIDGLEVLSRLRGMNETLPVVIVSAHGTASTALEAGRLGAFRFIEKPLSKDYVLDAVREGLELGTLRRENRHAAVGARDEASARRRERRRCKQILDQVRARRRRNATVLILGESGVGKELVARAIHRSSLRARERFVQVNCAAIPEELIESELFGHERGAFTGATEKQIGKFEMADRGHDLPRRSRRHERRRRRPRCCACCRKAKSSGSDRRGRSRSTSASSRRRTRTSKRKSPRAGSARISTSA